MIDRRTLLISCAFAFAAITSVTLAESYGAENVGPLAIVVSKSFPTNEISFGDLKRAYMGSPVVANGKPLVPITYPRGSPERIGFDKAVLGMSPEQIGLYWIDRKIRGQAGPPKHVPDAAAVLWIVGRVDGAIGFVRASAAGKDVKILRVDGKLPGDPGYRL
ncbi:MULTISPECIES: hypothetical protein [Sorangium]|uniref:Secreted protein n=1 Tax=Sorangium atrum TaxID=2995308 RepID=A0ABT5CB66_9BACT|nr:hypothetical protein [Sorangium aterium]MDC0682372.1 hypothetical protein [Sorangium aterium]